MVIVGAGYIACEQACIFNNFGTEVHMLYMEDVALSGEPSLLIFPILLGIVHDMGMPSHAGSDVLSVFYDPHWTGQLCARARMQNECRHVGRHNVIDRTITCTTLLHVCS